MGLIIVMLNRHHSENYRRELQRKAITPSKNPLAQVWPVYIYTHGSAQLTRDYRQPCGGMQGKPSLEPKESESDSSVDSEVGILSII